MVIYPYTEKAAREKQRTDRESAVNLAGIQFEMLARNYERRHSVSHDLFHRIVQSMLKIGAHLKLTQDRMESLEKKLFGAGMGDEFTVNRDGDGKRIYIEGHFDMEKLRKELLW
jgi:hypothetical protein